MSPAVSKPKSEVPVADLSEKSLQTLGKAFWALAGHYNLTRVEQALVLGFNKVNRQRLASLEEKKMIPDDPDKAYRVGILLGIHKNLRIIYPHNRDIVYAWLKTERDLFQGKTALEFVAAGTDTLPRLFTIRRILDQVRCEL